MIYYSTGKSNRLPKRGKAVESNNPLTAEILLNNGLIVKSKDELIDTKSTNSDIEINKDIKPEIIKPKVNNKSVKQKPKGRPRK